MSRPKLLEYQFWKGPERAVLSFYSQKWKHREVKGLLQGHTATAKSRPSINRPSVFFTDLLQVRSSDISFPNYPVCKWGHRREDGCYNADSQVLPQTSWVVSLGVGPEKLYFSIKPFLGSPALFQQLLDVLLLNDLCRVATICKPPPRQHKKDICYSTSLDIAVSSVSYNVWQLAMCPVAIIIQLNVLDNQSSLGNTHPSCGIFKRLSSPGFWDGCACLVGHSQLILAYPPLLGDISLHTCVSGLRADGLWYRTQPTHLLINWKGPGKFTGDKYSWALPSQSPCRLNMEWEQVTDRPATST